MATILRPMSTGEVLDRTFSLYRTNFLLFFGIATLPPALWLLMQGVIYSVSSMESSVATAGGNAAMSAGIASGVSIVLMFIAYLIGLAIAQAATIYAVSAVHLGRPTSIRESYHRVRGRYGRVLNVVLSVAIRVFGGGGLLVILSVTTFALIPALGSSMGVAGYVLGGIVGVVALIAAIIVAIGLFVRYSLAVPACVLEDIKARAAMKRSQFLAKGSRGRILAIYFLVSVLNWVVSWVVLIPIVILGQGAKGASATLALIGTHGMQFLVAALLGPIITIAISLVYYDERVRKEAFDIQLMMAALDGPQPPAAAGAPAGSIG